MSGKKAGTDEAKNPSKATTFVARSMGRSYTTTMKFSLSTRAYLIRLAGLGAAILVLSNIAAHTQKAAHPDFPALVWPACAIALAGMLVWGRNMWPAFYVPLAASSLTAGHPALFALGAPGAIAVCLVAACGSLRKRGFDPALVSLRDTIGFLTRGALLPMLLAGFGTAAAMWLAGMAPWKSLPAVGIVYGIAYAAGVALLTPPLLLASLRRPLNLAWDAVIPLSVLTLCLWISFSGAIAPTAGAMMSYVPFPFLMWAAWKGGLPAAVIGALITVATAIGYSAGGTGPFAGASGLAMFVQVETYIAVMATTALLAGSASESQRRETKARLEAANRDAETQRLKAQLHPHFLFNCLAAIHSLAETNPAAARGGIVSLADLLRSSLDNSEEDAVPMEREMRFVETYLDLQRMRFEDTLEASVRRDPSTEVYLVPPMLVQPLVENAIKHGEMVDGRLRLMIETFNTSDDFCIRVGNSSGDKARDPARWEDGTGLKSLKERLALAWGSAARLSLSKTRPDWIEATISVTKSALDEGPRTGR